MKDFTKRYLDILEGPLSGINLTRILNFEDFYNKQIMDSVLPLEKSKVFNSLISNSGMVIDVGFGGGFPLVPLAYLKKDVFFLGIDSKNKKAKAVELICQNLSVLNAYPIHGRIENFLIDIPSILIFKAVGKVINCIKLLSYSKDIHVFFYKGPGLYEQEDLDSLPENVRKIDEVEFELPDGSKRLLLGYEIKNVPRRTNNLIQSQKKLVKLSKIKTELLKN